VVSGSDYLYAILVLFQVIKLGVYQEEIEHQWPTPREMDLEKSLCLRPRRPSRTRNRSAKLMTNWPMVADIWELIERLEIPRRREGIIDQATAGSCEGVGKTGFDITAKSEPWKRGTSRH